MKYYDKNTLSYYQAAPQFHRVDLSHIPTKVLGESTKKYRENCGTVNPDNEALEFYCMNHLASIVRKSFTPHEPLPDWAKTTLESYLKVAVGQGNRMLHYLLSICTREMRHLKANTITETWWNDCNKNFGNPFTVFLKSICNVGEDSAVKKYMNEAPDTPLGQYISGLAWAFHKGKWNGGYGGKAWGKIADAAVSFVHGHTSLEALVDTGFTLAHNNGPIFNKGMMYDHYSANIMTILDVQRSGQIPELILDNTPKLVIPPQLPNAVKLVQKEMPNEFQGYVDWYKVEDLGAIGKYEKYKQLQKKKALEKPAEPKKKGPWEEVGTYQVWAGVSVPIMKRVLEGANV